jgi:DNA-binding response OmpR family regulator
VPPTILHVDDNDGTRYAISRVLQRAGYHVRPAESGAAALRELARGVPDLVLLDVNLPDTTGFELCRHIRGKRETAEVPVVYLSASYLAPEDKGYGLASGGDAYLTQPIEPAVLTGTIERILRDGSPRRPDALPGR